MRTCENCMACPDWIWLCISLLLLLLLFLLYRNHHKMMILIQEKARILLQNLYDFKQKRKENTHVGKTNKLRFTTVNDKKDPDIAWFLPKRVDDDLNRAFHVFHLNVHQIMLIASFGGHTPGQQLSSYPLDSGGSAGSPGERFPVIVHLCIKSLPALCACRTRRPDRSLP